MARDEKRRQKALQRHAAKRAQHQRQSEQPVTSGRPRAVPRVAATWPLYECLISRDWDREGELVQLLVARRSPRGEIAAGAYLVDLGSLGGKEGMSGVFSTIANYKDWRDELTAAKPMRRGDPRLAAKIIRDGLAYAAQLGFRPDPAFRAVDILLADADPDACGTPVPLGADDGKPFYVAGPYDDVEQIMSKLERAVGPDNFHFMVPVDALKGWVLEQ